jgi:hypothetical protein
MRSEYDPVRPDPFAGGQDSSLETVRRHFEVAAEPYLASPWSWLAWAMILPAAALLTPYFLERWSWLGVLFLWSAAVILGGVIEAYQIVKGRRQGGTTALATWVLRAQGNLSLVALLLSVVALWQGQAWILPGLWLLLLGHSLFTLGGLASSAMRSAGRLYQLGGVLALLPHGQSLACFAVATFLGNLWIGASIWRRVRQ